MELAEVAVVEVAEGGIVSVAGLPAPVVVGSGTGGFGEGGEGPAITGGGEPVVLHPAVQDEVDFAGGPSDGGGAGVGLECAGVGEA